jgi:hypothetical protein
VGVLGDRVKRWASRALVCLAVVLGLLALADAVDVRIAIGVGLLALLAAWPRLPRVPRVDSAVVRGAGAVLLALLALVGLDVVLHFAIDALDLPRLPIGVGLVFAAVVFAAVAYWSLRRAPYGKLPSGIAAVALALLVVVATPILVGALTAASSPVPTSRPVASKLDVLIVTAGRLRGTPRELPPDPSLAGFDVRYSVGVAAGAGVRWTLVGGEDRGEALRAIAAGRERPAEAGAPLPRRGADSVLLLLVDSTPPAVDAPAELPSLPGAPGEVERWQRVAAAAAPPGTPTFALLQTTGERRLGRWADRFASRGEAVSAQALESLTATDAAVRMAVAAPTSRTDFALAMEYRPVLLLDRAEPDPWPLAIHPLFAEGRVRLCHDLDLTGTDCGNGPVRSPAELESGGTHLRLELRSSRELKRLAREQLARQREEAAAAEGVPAPAAGGPGAAPEGTPPPGTAPTAGPGPPPGAGTAIYVHPSSAERDGRHLLYLDYWWYLTDNPVAVGDGALCGAGLVIAGVTCENHQSDWEGMTVVVDRSAAEPRAVAVHYAQHGDVVRYGWRQLRERWDGSAQIARLLAGVSDASTRPLAFVAEGTHSTYPIPCGDCSQVAHSELNDGPHRGDFGWVGNDSGACGRASCLQMLPTREAGREPALWNAFDGPWGEHHCFLVYYCDSGSPPASPGHQGRYLHPAQYDGYVDGRWRFHRAPYEE